VEPGDIVIADIPDPNGVSCGHSRPVMVLRCSPESNVAWVVGISTKFSATHPIHWLPLPCDGVTNLRESCVLKCDWVHRVSVASITGNIGKIPTPIFDLAVNHIVAEVQRKKAPNHTAK
jgi:hypothetical protein